MPIVRFKKDTFNMRAISRNFSQRNYLENLAAMIGCHFLLASFTAVLMAQICSSLCNVEKQQIFDLKTIK